VCSSDLGRCSARWAIGSDPAFAGRDRWTTIIGKGNKVLTLNGVDYSDAPTIADHLAARVLERGRFNCDLGVDCVGPGQGVGDNLDKIHGLGDILQRLNRKDSDWVAPMPSGAFVRYTDKSFDCWKTQAWVLLRDDLENNSIDLSELAEKWPEHWKQLKKEILAHSATEDKTGKIRVSTKEQVRKELGCSPDIADALVAWNWVRKRNDDGIPREKTYRRYDFWEEDERPKKCDYSICG
jgi:hypothetical protein